MRRLRHARLSHRSPAPRRLYSVPYEPLSRAPLRPLAVLRRLLRRARPAERLSHSVYNLLGRRAGELATVVYSDRYFRYGLPLAARLAPLRRRVGDELGAGGPVERRAACSVRSHVMPLCVWARPAGGVLLGVCGPASSLPRARPAPRRVLQAEPRLLRVLEDARFEPEGPARAAGSASVPRRALDWRQAAAGVLPRQAPAGRARRAASPPRDPPDEAPAPRPQFALDAVSLRSASGPAKASPRASRNLSPWEAEGDKASSMTLARKVLNTERYNNGAEAVLYRRGSRGSRGSRRVRATIRAMLAVSGLFYALSFLTFYFLSLP